MAILTWDNVGERQYETGVDRGVLYIPTAGVYDIGYAWNGLVSVTESPSGAEATAQYADNIKYLNLISAEEFGATIEAFTYPKEFAQCDGSATPQPGVVVGQQDRKQFGLSYRTRVGNDVSGTAAGYKIHLVYGAQAAPTEKAFTTINDSPEAITFSWEITTTPVSVTGLKPTAILTIDSTKANAASLLVLENALYGTAGTAPRLPLPDEVIAMFAGTVTVVTATQPSFVAAGGTATIPTITGVVYRRGDTNAVIPAGAFVVPVIATPFIIKAAPASGAYQLAPGTDDDWSFTRTS